MIPSGMKIVQLLWQDYDICDHRGTIIIAHDADMLALYREYCQTHKPAAWLHEDDIGFLPWLIQEKGAVEIDVEEFDLSISPFPV